MKNVTIIQRILPHYRVPLFRKMRSRLLEKDVNMRLIYGQEYPGTVPKTVDLPESWAHRVRNSYLKAKDFELVWQPCLNELKSINLVVVEQANRLLLNYFLFMKIAANKSRIAFYGHGRNFQSVNTSRGHELWKKLWIDKVDWWFAYTDLSAKHVAESGFPKDRTTIVNNSIDTAGLAAACAQISDKDIAKIKKELGISSENICVFCGGMHENKRLDFLIASCIELRTMIPDFHMVFIGDGPQRAIVSEACARHPWMHYVGAKFDREKAAYLKAAKALLMPGLVGLVIIDSFVAGVPLITTDISIHSPEIAYLDNNKNGLMTDSTLRAYADEVARYLSSPENQEQLKRGCAESAKTYSLERMVENLVSGIVACLFAPPLKRMP